MLPHAKRLPTRSTDSEISDPAASYTLYTDASKYAMQVYSHNDRMTPITQLHTSVDISEEANSTGSLRKEAYAIYMSVKKLTFYLDSACITVRSDHLPLKRFWKRTLSTLR